MTETTARRARWLCFLLSLALLAMVTGDAVPDAAADLSAVGLVLVLFAFVLCPESAVLGEVRPDRPRHRAHPRVDRVGR